LPILVLGQTGIQKRGPTEAFFLTERAPQKLCRILGAGGIQNANVDIDSIIVIVLTTIRSSLQQGVKPSSRR
jgi:hypothetical protein